MVYMSTVSKLIGATPEERDKMIDGLSEENAKYLLRCVMKTMIDNHRENAELIREFTWGAEK